MDVRVAIQPSGATSIPKATAEMSSSWRRQIGETVENAGGRVVSVPEANGLVWLAVGSAAPLITLLDANPRISWVQLPWAGVDSVVTSGLFSRPITVTCAKRSFADQVAEHVLMLSLSCLRHVVAQSRRPSWYEAEPESLSGKRVTILGAGGVAEALVRHLQPFGCKIRVLRRNQDKLEGADETLTIDFLSHILPDTDVLILALALTPQTRQIIGAPELALLNQNAIVVNVARGAHIDTAALTDALAAGRIAAAGLDVTDPEPLPPGHPLWSLDNVLITSHCADSVEFVMARVRERIRENVQRLIEGKPLIGTVDPTAGY